VARRAWPFAGRWLTSASLRSVDRRTARVNERPSTILQSTPCHPWRVNWSRLFRSRWAALCWAGSVLWFAYDVASAAPDAGPPAEAAVSNTRTATDVTGAPVNEADVAGILNAVAS